MDGETENRENAIVISYIQGAGNRKETMNKTPINSEMAIGAQPTVDALKQLKEEGFRSIINLRRPDEPSPLNPEQEAQVVRTLGMEYQHIPVSPQTLSVDQAEKFDQVMRTLPKPVFVHCQGGTRAGAFSLMHLGREKGWTGEQAFQEGEKVGFKCESPALKQFVSSQLDRSGKPS
jgi:uncharacterized protein (TIGR01244 family)